MEKPLEFIISPEQKGQRLDLFLALAAQAELSRSHVKKLIEAGLVTVNGQPSEPSYKLKADDRLKVVIPPPPEATLRPQDIPLDIIYEDADIIVVNKPKGLVVHPAPGNPDGTLVNALLHHCGRLASQGLPLRPGIVHRLDKETAGLIVVAKTDKAYLSLVRQFKERTVEKTYIALVHGVLKNDDGAIEAKLGRHPVHRKKIAVLPDKGREALTLYHVLRRFKGYTLVEMKIKTGRTHQIRVHMSHIGHPLAGDQTYGGQKDEFGLKGQFLHAGKLAFIHPTTGERVEFSAGLPQAFKDVLAGLKRVKPET